MERSSPKVFLLKEYIATFICSPKINSGTF